MNKLEAELAADRRIALAFLDMRMPPGWDGLETARRLWKADPELQIVICTAFADYSLEEMVEKLGRLDQWVILKKPFDPVEVIQLANSLTVKWRLQQSAKQHSDKLEQGIRERTTELLNANARLQAEIHQRIQAEESLLRNQKTLLRQERLAAVGEVTAGVAHEFNNILTVILGNASLVAGETTQPSVAQALDMIIESSERAANLVRQLLAYSRRQSMRCEALQLNDVVQNATRVITAALPANIRVRFDLGVELPLVQADATKMEQVLLNLAVNARDAMEGGGELVVSTSHARLSEEDAAKNEEWRRGDFVCLQVSDTGAGMTPAVMARMFEPFFTTKDIGKGTGLGLSSVHGTVRQHEGWITVDSQPGQGSAFRVFLPAQSQQADNKSSRALPHPSLAGSESILLVEDELGVRQLIKSALHTYGYNVVDAPSAEDALARWTDHSRKFDMLVTDLVLSGELTGVQLHQKLSQDRPGMPVIFISGYSRDLLSQDGRLPQNADFLQKPFDIRALLTLVRARLDHHRRR